MRDVPGEPYLACSPAASVSPAAAPAATSPAAIAIPATGAESLHTYNAISLSSQVGYKDLMSTLSLLTHIGRLHG